MLVPNFFTLLSLCAGLTAIRMAIEQRYEMAIALVVIAALLDGVDGRLARALKAQSKFGAELDSLADFVNFGVAPAVIVFIWGLGSLRGASAGSSVLVFALAMGLRLARFNAMIDVEKPKWQSNYFTGMPAPAGAITVLLPLYLDGLGLFDVRAWPVLIAFYTLAMAVPAGVDHPDLLGQAAGRAHLARVRAADLRRRRRAGGAARHLPLRHADAGHAVYLGSIPISYGRFEHKLYEPAAQTAAAPRLHPSCPSEPTTAKRSAARARPSTDAAGDATSSRRARL